MLIGAIKEQNKEETRIALTPTTVKQFIADGYSVIIENGFWEKSGFSSHDYSISGLKITPNKQEIYTQSDILLQIQPPDKSLLHLLQKHQLLLADFSHDKEKTPCNGTILHLERIPRLSAAQSFDIISTQTTVRGYSAAIYALSHAKFITPQLITAATSIKAAEALIIGASITGLQAASVCKHVGCRTTILDINQQNKDLASSVGAKFVIAQTPEEMKQILKDKKIIIAAATAPKNTPQIITPEHLPLIAPNTVIIDTTEKNISFDINSATDKDLFFHRNLYFERLAPLTASELWAHNVMNLIKQIVTSHNSFDLSAPYIKPMISK